MIAVITGDIVNSRNGEASQWLPLLKNVLNQYGAEPGTWEIFRGDSFQLMLPPKEAFRAAINLKASIKQMAALDVRLAIGIGEEGYRAGKISESTGLAFNRSGTCFDALKKRTLAIVTPNDELNESLNTMLDLALLTIDNWSPVVATIIKSVLDNPDKNQKELSKLLKKSQSSISEALKRGGYEEVKQLENFYENQITKL